MHAITLARAKGRLAEMIEQLPPGGEIVVTRDEPVATIRAASISSREPPKFGTY